MKFRLGFVSNSSSSSFIISVSKYMKTWSIIKFPISVLQERLQNVEDYKKIWLESYITNYNPSIFTVGLRSFVIRSIESKMELKKYLKENNFEIDSTKFDYWPEEEQIEYKQSNDELLNTISQAYDNNGYIYELKFNRDGDCPQSPEENLISHLGLETFNNGKFKILLGEEG